MNILYPLAKRFIAGENVEGLLETMSKLIENVTINYVGESCSNKKTIEENLNEYEYLIYHLQKMDGTYELSPKLSQFGTFDRDLLYAAKKLKYKTQNSNISIKFDMEQEDTIQRTLDIAKEYRFGVVLQANMNRSQNDIEDVMSRYGCMRICKGAYDGDIKEDSKIREAYLCLVETAFKNKRYMNYHLSDYYKKNLLSIATHDESLIKEIKTLANRYDCKQEFYFELLYGIRKDLIIKLLRQGYNVRTYLPYGENWLYYVCRRLKEFKNLKFVFINLMREYGTRLFGKPST